MSVKRLVKCPHCCVDIRATESAEGRNVTCPSCKGPFVIRFEAEVDDLGLVEVTPPNRPDPLVSRGAVFAPTANRESPAHLPAPNGAVADVAATYFGGHHSLLDVTDGNLSLEANRLVFANVSGECLLQFPYKQIADLHFPEHGAFPREFLTKSEGLKTAAKAVGVAAKTVGLMGKWGSRIGLGSSTEDVSDAADTAMAAGLVAGAGGIAADLIGDAAKLGPTPRNRLHVILIESGVPFRLVFDVRDGKTTTELDDATATFWRRSALVRSQFRKLPGELADA